MAAEKRETILVPMGYIAIAPSDKYILKTDGVQSCVALAININGRPRNLSILAHFDSPSSLQESLDRIAETIEEKFPSKQYKATAIIVGGIANDGSFVGRFSNTDAITNPIISTLDKLNIEYTYKHKNVSDEQFYRVSINNGKSRVEESSQAEAMGFLKEIQKKSHEQFVEYKERFQSGTRARLPYTIKTYESNGKGTSEIILAERKICRDTCMVL